MTGKTSDNSSGQILVLLAVWLVAALILALLALPNLSSPGLYYDEAVNAGLAKDFVTASTQGAHLPGTEVVWLRGRPFPVFVQWYSGAVKPWLIVPSLVFFDATTGVLRATSLFWYLLGMLLCMLWTRRLLGLPAAILVVPILGLDPSFFFPAIVDWGPIIPSFLCRFAGYYLLIRWWHNKKTLDGFLGGVALGIGFFAKIDFVVILLGCGVALVLSYGRDIFAFVCRSPKNCAWCCLGLLLGASPMALIIPAVFHAAAGGGKAAGPSELLEKIHTAVAMYDGSYFYRLMNVGGNFDTMFTPSCPSWSPFGLAVILSGVLLTLHIVLRRGEAAGRRRLVFLLLSAILLTSGVFLVPDAVRIHHHLAVYPFPHLIVAAAIVMLWKKSPLDSTGKWGLRAGAVVLAVTVIGGHLLVMRQTQDLIAATGGRGYFSDSVEEFCKDIRDQNGLVIVSLDWGFNEQLDYLCSNKRLLEPIWHSQTMPAGSKAVYLLHPPKYMLVPAGLEYYRQLQQAYAGKLSIRPYHDREGHVVFYAVRLLK